MRACACARVRVRLAALCARVRALSVSVGAQCKLRASALHARGALVNIALPGQCQRRASAVDLVVPCTARPRQKRRDGLAGLERLDEHLRIAAAPAGATRGRRGCDAALMPRVNGTTGRFHLSARPPAHPP